MLKEFIQLNIKLGKPIKIGQTNEGYLKIIPILGGSFKGKISGEIIKWGGDINFKYNQLESTADATYILQTLNSQKILVHNSAVINKTYPMFTHPIFLLDKKSTLNSILKQTFLGKIEPIDKFNINIKIYSVK